MAGGTHVPHTEVSLICSTPWFPKPWSEVKVKVIQSCPTLGNPMDSRVHGILQARILEWVAVPFSRGSSQPRDQTQVSRIAGGFFTAEPPGKPKNTGVGPGTCGRRGDCVLRDCAKARSRFNTEHRLAAVDCGCGDVHSTTTGRSPDAEAHRPGAMLSSVHPHPLCQKMGTDGVDTRGPPASAPRSPLWGSTSSTDSREDPPKSSWSLSSGIPSHPPVGRGVLSGPQASEPIPPPSSGTQCPLSCPVHLTPLACPLNPAGQGLPLPLSSGVISACSKRCPWDAEQLCKHWMSQEMSPWTQTRDLWKALAQDTTSSSGVGLPPQSGRRANQLFLRHKPKLYRRLQICQ